MKTKKVKKEEGWKKPPDGKLLLNVDVSYKAESSTGSTGAIIRDSTQSFIGARICYRENLADAAMAEANALKEGLVLAQMMGCNRIMIQSDFFEVVETMKLDGVSVTLCVPIYDECCMIWQDFISISIDHCNQEANCVAHELAKVAMQSKLSCNWVNEPLSFIL